MWKTNNGSQLYFVSNAGHKLFMNNPDEFNGYILEAMDIYEKNHP